MQENTWAMEGWVRVRMEETLNIYCRYVALLGSSNTRTVKVFSHSNQTRMGGRVTQKQNKTVELSL
jgi:hypothetical protein